MEDNSGRIISEETAEELDSLFDNKETEAFEKVEAALFISGKFLTLTELIMLTDVNPIMLKEILHRLEKKYSTGALRLIKGTNSWKMDVAEKYYFMVNKLATGTAEFSRAEQETLAVIAYKQPIKQSVIIKIRGNKAYDHINKFAEVGLITSKRVGHTKEVSLAEDFYEYFNVQQSQKEKDDDGEE